jgi:hypothetical protein
MVSSQPGFIEATTCPKILAGRLAGVNYMGS